MILRLTQLTLSFIFATAVAAQSNSEHTRAWGDIDYHGHPWVRKTSRPHKISKGLENRHIVLWASHGRYYDQEELKWKWQRPYLFGTTEDLFTQTIVVPYLIPMLENAGANVFTPRERDWQAHEIIVDNDDPDKGTSYIETNGEENWYNSNRKGFAQHAGTYSDGENPFEQGTVRAVLSTKRKNTSWVSYQPRFPEEGKYAVYVSYQTLPESVDDAEYIVYHKGQATAFRVNQQMGGGTWVYLGTFDFDSGSNLYNRVVVTNNSKKRKRIVTTDAVRFGGGMGNIERGGSVSGLPRTLEGSRYYAQWAGAPYSVYSSKGGDDDYSDDINVRSKMSNWLAGGSVFVPTLPGLGVPLELSLAVHSDAGYAKDGKSLIGSLSICTTDFNDGRLNSGISRMASKDFAGDLLDNLTKDLSTPDRPWARRFLWDRNYSETRLPEVPSAILEILSHQSFPDMVLGQDPNFKFTLARSVYKTILKYVCHQHGRKYIVQPLAPQNFRIEFTAHNKVKLSWNAQTDAQEPSAVPASYNIYTSTGTSGFDNGINVKGTSHTIELEPDIQYNFKVTACNKGGESFPTEVLSAYHSPSATKSILIINGFNRLSAPHVIDNDSLQGFDLDKDMGVSYGLTAGWAGRQTGFRKAHMGNLSEIGLGYSGNELEGHFIAGNTFDYVTEHADAIAYTKKYNVVSASSEAVLSGKIKLQDYPCVDLVLGLEKYMPYATKFYKTFTARMQQLLSSYTKQGGNIVVSGSYIGSDMTQEVEKAFLDHTLKIAYTPNDSLAKTDSVQGLGMEWAFYQEPNNRHYAATSPEILSPAAADAFCVMRYANGGSAAVAYRGNGYRSLTMGFPFECITDTHIRRKLMSGILKFLLE